jgi:hypothetical protein
MEKEIKPRKRPFEKMVEGEKDVGHGGVRRVAI